MTKRSGLIGTKIGNSSYHNVAGKSLPVTIIKIDDCIVSNIKTIERDGYLAIQLASIDKNIEIAKTPPSSFYTSQEIFRKSKSFFENSYQFICHKNELNNVSCYPFNLFKNWIDIPLIITKEADQTLNCLCLFQFLKKKVWLRVSIIYLHWIQK